MSQIKIDQFFIQSNSLHVQMQSVGTALSQPPLTTPRFHRLEKKLDNAAQALHTIEQRYFCYPIFQGAIDELGFELSSLSRRVLETWAHDEIEAIEREATQVLHAGKDAARAAHALRAHIDAFKQQYQPSLEERRILAQALDAAANCAFLQCAEARAIPTELTYFPGEIEELMEIARLVYENEVWLARKHFRALPPELQRMVDMHLQQLGAEAFAHPLATIQALLASANDLVGNGESYPTAAEIEDLFTGLKELR